MSTNDESVSRFKAFDNYNFDKDEQFQAGIASLLNNKQDNEAELLDRAKLFYYTKMIEQFDVEAYKAWKIENKKTPEKQSADTDSEKPPRFTFQELVDMIERGIEIPGIKQIPNVLNEGTPSEAKMTVRPKPWEINKQV